MAVFKLKRLFTYGDNIFDFNVTYLMLVGLWQDTNWTRKQKMLYKIYEYTLHVLGFTYLFISIIGTYAHMEDITDVLIEVDKCLATYNFVSKITVFLFRRKEFRRLVGEMIASGDTMPENHKILMAKISVASTLITTGIASVFITLSMIAGELPINLWLPFDTAKSFMNLLAGVQISVLTFGVPICYRGLAVKCFVSTTIFYMRDQLIDVQDKIKQLDFAKDEEEMRLNFKKIIKKHIRLMRFSNALDNVLKEYFLVQNLAITLELCMIAVILTLIGLTQKTLAANFLAFLFMALVHAFIYCYLGNEIVTQSEGIATVAYDTCWTSWPVDLQKDLLILITASQRPFKLTAGGMSVMSLQTYGQTLYNGYSVFAVLNDAVN